MATSSANRCTTEFGRTTWTAVSTRAGSLVRGSGGAGVRRRTLWQSAPLKCARPGRSPAAFSESAGPERSCKA
eukprot:2763695-Alexandrium_andersonii.AAC.1